MKQICFLLLGMLGGTIPLSAQYCMLSGQTPYSANQPGITNFKLNTINRTSGNSESSASVVVVTGLTTTITPGQTYTISITHSEDAVFFPGARNNLRVWIDYNNNFSFTDAGETVLSVDLQSPGTTYSSTITIPLATPPGTLTLRATAKMSADAGHTLPTSCNAPADPLGYHGEMEDYKLIMEGANPGQTAVSVFALSPSVCASGAVTPTNNSIGTPSPGFNWSVSPSAGVTFSPGNLSMNPKISFSTPGNYTVTCIATNSLGSNSSKKVINVLNCTVGISDKPLDFSFGLVPNPAQDQFSILLSEEIKLREILLYNSYGSLLLKKPLSTLPQERITVDVSDLPDGVYYVKLVSTGTETVRKLILSR